ncbi:MAG: FAD-dependent oxidoreductase, partial [Pseudomonadota bacterium]
PTIAASAARLKQLAEDLFPSLGPIEIVHQWGGAVGVPRDQVPSVGFDKDSGFAWGGGYLGEGVAAANLAGRCLADLITERDSDLVRLPWVNHRSPNWEPEPIRWAGIAAMRGVMAASDWLDNRG